MIKRKILIVSPLLHAVSGVATHINILFNSDLKDTYRFIHCAIGSEGRIENFPKKLIRLFYGPLNFFWVLISRNPGIIHLNTSINFKAYSRDLMFFLISKLLGRKIIYQIHGGDLPVDFCSNRLFLNWLFRRILLLSDMVVVLSEEELHAYRAYESGINIKIIPNAIDGVKLIKANRKPNYSNQIRLAYVGRLVRSKGLFETVEALRIYKSRGGRFTMKIAGVGPDDEELRSEVEKSGLSSDINFLGAVFGDARDEILLSSDLFMFPTWHREGLPYSLLESMACGCVPITCSVGAIPDVIQNGIHGVFVLPNKPEDLVNVLEKLDSNHSLIERMGVEARKRVSEEYSVKRLVNDFDSLYSTL